MPSRHDPLLERLAPVKKLARYKRWGYAIALVSVGIAVMLRLLLSNVIDVGIFVTFYPAVFLTVMVGRFGPGMLSAILAVGAADYFFLPPIHSIALFADEGLDLALFAANLTLAVAGISLLLELLDRLWRQQDDLRFVLDTEPVGIASVDAAGGITLANHALMTMLGYSADELIGRPINAVLPEEFSAPAPKAPSADSHESYALRCDGTPLPVEIRRNPVCRHGTPGMLVSVLDITERKSAERIQNILTHEVQHRAGNLLTVIQVIASRTLTTNRSMEEAKQILLARLKALGRTQALFAAQGGAELRSIVAGELTPLTDDVTISGSAILLPSRIAQNFSLIVHELCTNALKYGALSCSGGTVSVAWERQGDEFVFSWSEGGGPPVREPSRKGFGQTVLNELPKNFGATVSAEYAETGFRYRLTTRWDRIAAPDDALKLIA
ncbi:MAG: PAS domain S-box protein [Alphaproteobacteria bacterium]|nr:PAS domain S-box protein [Alphaproteobacteria bacterium]